MSEKLYNRTSYRTDKILTTCQKELVHDVNKVTKGNYKYSQIARAALSIITKNKKFRYKVIERIVKELREQDLRKIELKIEAQKKFHQKRLMKSYKTNKA